jgi:hypothetical protein
VWREAMIKFTDDVNALTCSVIPAHPWVYGLGQQTENGTYLSPANAVSYLTEKLRRMSGTADVIIMMVAGQTHDSFINELNRLVEVFPAPALTQVKRLALSAAELAIEKMQIPAMYDSGMPGALPLSVPTSRKALSAAVVKKAQEEAASGVDIDALKKQLDEFIHLRDGLLDGIAGELSELQGKCARVWVFTASGNVSTTLLEMVKGIPLLTAVHSAALMLIGDNLDGIKGMIHDIEPDAGA